QQSTRTVGDSLWRASRHGYRRSHARSTVGCRHFERRPPGVRRNFVVSFCVALIRLALIVLLVDNPTNQIIDGSETERTLSLGRLNALFCQPGFRALMIVGSALSLVTVSDGLLYLALRERMSIQNGVFPLLYVLTALAFMVLAIPAGRLADRIGHGVVFVL